MNPIVRKKSRVGACGCVIRPEKQDSEYWNQYARDDVEVERGTWDNKTEVNTKREKCKNRDCNCWHARKAAPISEIIVVAFVSDKACQGPATAAALNNFPLGGFGSGKGNSVIGIFTGGDHGDVHVCNLAHDWADYSQKVEFQRWQISGKQFLSLWANHVSDPDVKASPRQTSTLASPDLKNLPLCDVSGIKNVLQGILVF